MKLSVLPVSYFKAIVSGEMSIGDWAREGVELGLDAIDISILFLTERDEISLRSFRKEVEDAGIHICGASTYPDFTHPDPTERKRQKEQFKYDLDALSKVGTKVVRITGGQGHPVLKRQDGIAWALEGILGAVAAADQHGIQLVFENHAKPGVWDYPDFDFPTDIFLEMAQQLKDTPVKIQFDTANPIAFGDDPLPILEQVIDRVAVVHASDTSVKGELVPSVIGTGLVPFDKILGRLAEHGYEGWISIEEASGTGAVGVITAVEFIRETWASAAGSNSQVLS
jgi:sugar phosphate isomerase/epimerase